MHNEYQISFPPDILRGVTELPPSLKGGSSNDQMGVIHLPKGGQQMTPNNNRITKNNNRRFTPPSLTDVTQYCQDRQNTVNPETFIDFYQSKGWMVGSNRMKDWKAAVRTWERKQKPESSDYTDTLDQLL